MTDEHLHPEFADFAIGGQSAAPRRIDVFVDGCWLFRGKHNPVEAGGWGAILIESRGDREISRWTPSGRLPQEATSSAHSEWIAALRGMQAAVERQAHYPDNAPATIVLHTDQIDMPRIIESTLQNPVETPTTGKESWRQELAQLVQQTGATVEYTKARKCNDKITARESKCMDIAHELASLEAQTVRAEQQGHLSFGPTLRIEPEQLEGFLQKMRMRTWKMNQQLDAGEPER